jgi:hypothetical protein
MAKVKLYDSPEWLRLQFLTKKKTIEEIAKECSCSTNTIRTRLKQLKLIK